MSHEVIEILEHEKEHDETEVGNYFVANYPPFSYWDAETAKTVRGLLDLAPETATRITSTGEEETVETAVLAPGDEILVRPGERIGGDGIGDGIVVEGASDVDQATITGEPLPVDKCAGDEVFAGTVNGSGALRVRVTRPASDTVIAFR